MVVSNGSKSKNIGWRLDYFVVSERMKDQITAAKINSEVMGSDHCPVELYKFLKKYPPNIRRILLFNSVVKIFQIFLEIIAY